MPDGPAERPRPLLQRPDLEPKDRARIGRAVSWLLGAGLVGIISLGGLAIWHLVRRGRLIRDRLADPKSSRALDLGAGLAGDDPPRPSPG